MLRDSDQDGLPDPWEYLYFDSLRPQPWQDKDHDRLTHQEEMQLARTRSRFLLMMILFQMDGSKS